MVCVPLSAYCRREGQASPQHTSRNSHRGSFCPYSTRLNARAPAHLTRAHTVHTRNTCAHRTCLSACVSAGMCARARARTHAHIDAHACTQAHTHACTHAHAHAHACMQSHARAHRRMHTCRHRVHTCAHPYTCMHAHTHPRVYMLQRSYYTPRAIAYGQ